MSVSQSSSLPRSLSPELMLKRASSAEELEAVAACHLANFDDDDPLTMRAKLFHRPGGSPQDVILVQDIKTGEAVSSVSLIRETWTYEGIPFRVGEVGIVSTREAYRKRGLVREEFAVYHRMAEEAGCLISVITGIPYFYRQFGYEYVFPMETGLEVRLDQVPDLAEGESSPFTVRPATPQDMPMLQRFYAESVKGLCVATVFSEEIWRYQDGLPVDCKDRRATYLVERRGEAFGYLRINAHEDLNWHKGLRIRAAYLPSHDACMAALRFAKQVALHENRNPLIGVDLPYDCPLMQAASILGGKRHGPYGWYVRVLDPVGFLTTIGPALGRRLAGSPLAGLTQEVAMNLYTQVIVLRFRGGRLEGVELVPKVKEHHLSCPPGVASMIWLGSRSVAEVVDWYPDAFCKNRAAQRLIDILFPKRESWICWLF